VIIKDKLRTDVVRGQGRSILDSKLFTENIKDKKVKSKKQVSKIGRNMRARSKISSKSEKSKQQLFEIRRNQKEFGLDNLDYTVILCYVEPKRGNPFLYLLNLSLSKSHLNSFPSSFTK